MKINSRIFDLGSETCFNYLSHFENSKTFSKQFLKDFDSIIAYHATNLNKEEMNSVRQFGLKKGTKTLLRRKALKRFLRNSDSKELQNLITIYIKNYFESIELISKSEINFGLERDKLLTEFNQYLIFGPETLLPLAFELERKFQIEFRKRMIEFGDYIIIKVKIPVQYVDRCWIKNIFDYEFEECSIVYHRVLASEHIIKITKIKRVLNISKFFI